MNQIFTLLTLTLYPVIMSVLANFVYDSLKGRNTGALTRPFAVNLVMYFIGSVVCVAVIATYLVIINYSNQKWDDASSTLLMLVVATAPIFSLLVGTYEVRPTKLGGLVWGFFSGLVSLLISLAPLHIFFSVAEIFAALGV